MNVFGIISEYNPMHNGHVYQINETRKMGATHIIAVMSGNYVQRGDISIIDKFTRAKLAIKNGADLVIELPVIYSLSTAEIFAEGAVSILNSLGCVDGISFGSECGDIDTIIKASKIAQKISNSEELKALLKKGMSYPNAIQNLCNTFYGEELSEVLSSPNNLLGIEYIKALKHFKSKINPFTVLRNSALHDSELSEDEFASASLIRKLIKEKKIFSDFVPQNVNDCIETFNNDKKLHLISNLDTIIMYKLRTMTENDFMNLPDVSQGLENRLYSSVKSSNSVDEILSAVKTKRYPLSKLRRTLLNALLNIKKSDIKRNCPYARVLAFNDKGCEILKSAKMTSSIPIDTSLKNLSEYSKECKKLTEIESRATDIYNISAKKIEKCGADFTTKIAKQ